MTTPTDAELLEVIREASRGGAIRRDGTTSLRIARAVLAKWGQPQAVAGGEPVAWMDDRGLVVSAEWLASDEATSDYRAVYNTPLYTAPPPQAVREPTIQWPKARDVGRIGDMSPDAHLRVGLDSDNDVYVSVWDEHGGGSVEFCNGGGGGGQSSRTRLALIALMIAMEADNADKPSRDWWALRMGGITKGGQHGAE